MRCLKILCALAGALWLAACGKTPPTQQEAYVFGTRVEVLVHGKHAQAKPAIAAVLQEFDRLHRTYHAWQPSELTTLNAALAEGRPQRVSDELAGLLREAQRLSRETDGLFDPGIGRLIALWGFQADQYSGQLPDVEALAAWRQQRPGMADLMIGADQRVFSRKRSVALDFGGYLKGVALDRAAHILQQHGIHDALINIGGNILALGSKDGQPWQVGVQHPRQPGVLVTLPLRDGEAIGTSGDYQRYIEVEGRRYSHLLDPRTAAPATETQALTILVTPAEADGQGVGMRSDVLSKPLFMAGEAWPAMARRLGVTHVLRVAADGQVSMSDAMQARIGPLKVQP